MVRHIQAYFNEEDDAEAAATDLRALGAIEVTADRTPGDLNGRFPADTAAVIPMIPQNQGSMVGASYMGQPNNVLLPGLMFRGGLLPDGLSREDGGQPVVTAVVEDRQYDKAVEAIERRGGKIG
ncbi:hypothetical protein FE782_05635 [Paenibacillus antri]|uniref:Uncharacterized protein n=1 Tax=Paenibacillus antri TaxID=2582848 RepID=A0A5R9GJZ1_9BACL|nr:hypothetical protein [Paenibacillus antri]TLS53748.1 hypothetical protein FE782_05635 [Paenibacillus antri]